MCNRMSLEGEGENWNSMIQYGSPHPKVGGIDQDPVGNLFAPQVSKLFACLDTAAEQVFSMKLPELEHGGFRADSVPADAANEACDMPGKPRRTAESADSGRLDARAQKPKKSTDVVHVRVAHKDVAHLMYDLHRETAAVTEIQQQAVPALAQPDMQQRVAEETIDQQCTGDTEVNEAGRIRALSLRDNQVGR
jgi:hypothetical protein